MTELEQKGSFTRGERENIEWQVRGTLYYTNTFKDKHMFSTGFSTELSESTEDNANWTGPLALWQIILIIRDVLWPIPKMVMFWRQERDSSCKFFLYCELLL